MPIDDLQRRLPPVLKWAFVGIGAAWGWSHAQEHHSPIPLSCVVAGTAAGFCFLACAFAGLRLLRAALIICAVLFVLNFVVLIPYGYGDYLPTWLKAGKSAGEAVFSAVERLADAWGRGY